MGKAFCKYTHTSIDIFQSCFMMNTCTETSLLTIYFTKTFQLTHISISVCTIDNSSRKAWISGQTRAYCQKNVHSFQSSCKGIYGLVCDAVQAKVISLRVAMTFIQTNSGEYLKGNLCNAFHSLNDLVRERFQVGFVIPCGDGYTCITSVYYEDIPFYYPILLSFSFK